MQALLEMKQGGTAEAVPPCRRSRDADFGHTMLRRRATMTIAPSPARSSSAVDEGSGIFTRNVWFTPFHRT